MLGREVGQQSGVAPKGLGPVGDRLSSDRGSNSIEVVDDLDRPEALVADGPRLDRIVGSTLPAPELPNVVLAHVLLPL